MTGQVLISPRTSNLSVDSVKENEIGLFRLSTVSAVEFPVTSGGHYSVKFIPQWCLLYRELLRK